MKGENRLNFLVCETVLYVSCFDSLSSVLLCSFYSSLDKFFDFVVECVIEIASYVYAVCGVTNSRLLKYVYHAYSPSRNCKASFL